MYTSLNLAQFQEVTVSAGHARYPKKGNVLVLFNVVWKVTDKKGSNLFGGDMVGAPMAACVDYRDELLTNKRLCDNFFLLPVDEIESAAPDIKLKYTDASTAKKFSMAFSKWAATLSKAHKAEEEKGSLQQTAPPGVMIDLVCHRHVCARGGAQTQHTHKHARTHAHARATPPPRSTGEHRQRTSRGRCLA